VAEERGLPSASGCAGPAPQGALDLSSANLGNLSMIASLDYPGQLIVDPGNPMMSALYEELLPTAAGGQMPVGFQLPPADIACVAAWITTYTPSMR
jgi:hypothetical protein